MSIKEVLTPIFLIFSFSIPLLLHAQTLNAKDMVNIASGLNPANVNYVVQAYILCKSKPVDKKEAAKNQTALELDAQALIDKGDMSQNY